MNILIVEDDYLQAEWFQKELKKEFPRANIDIIKTEYKFRSCMEEIAKKPPDVIVMDIMLRWADPSPDMPQPPDDVKNEGFYRAGLRCQKLLAESEKTRIIPVILYTVLERNDLKENLQKLPSHVIHLPKESSLTPLVREIRRLITHS